MNKEITFGSLFAGIGGIDLGFERAGFTCKWQVEIDDYANKVLEKHWPNVHRERDINECGKKNLGYVDVIAGGFPCQDLSYAGRGAGLDGERSGLFFETVRLVCELRPRVVVLENVSALLTRGLDRVLGTLAQVGFDAEWHVVPASAVGAFHQRERLWIVAYSKRIGLPRSWELAPPVHPTPPEFGQANRLVDAFLEGSMPFVCGGHDGVPQGVDREAVRMLGNAVVPQIPRAIGEAIISQFTW